MSHSADKTDQAAMAEIYASSPRVDCQLCCISGALASTKLCDRCWELDSRIRQDPHLAEEILARIKKERLG